MSKIDDERESEVRISLLDVMYGVVLAYGFNSFDRATDLTDYIRFFFACAIFVIDWIYVHRLYWGSKYKKSIYLVLDLCVLFSISRLLFTSTYEHTPSYFLWLSVLFIFYVVWDIIAKKNSLPSKYDWRFSVSGDVIACIVFFLLWVVSITKQFFLDWISSITKQPESVFLTALAVIVYINVVLFTWFKKTTNSKNKN